MTSITADKTHLEQASLGETTLELVAIRYTGDRTSLSVTNHLNNEGEWPSLATLQGATDENGRSIPGPWYYALVPDSGLRHLENRPDVEVLYGTDSERFAAALLDERRLPQNVFGQRSNGDIRERVFDALGLVPEVEGGPVRDQLREIADVDAEDDPEPADTSLETDLADGYTRSELGDLCKALREDAAECNLNETQSKTDRAAFIAEFDEEDRAAAIDDVIGGDE